MNSLRNPASVQDVVNCVQNGGLDFRAANDHQPGEKHAEIERDEEAVQHPIGSRPRFLTFRHYDLKGVHGFLSIRTADCFLVPATKFFLVHLMEETIVVGLSDFDNTTIGMPLVTTVGDFNDKATRDCRDKRS